MIPTIPRESHKRRAAVSANASMNSTISQPPRPRASYESLPIEYNIAELFPQVCNIWECTFESLAANDADIVLISLPSTKAALPAYYILAPAEASLNLARYEGLHYGHRDPSDRSDKEHTLFAPTLEC
jgi:Asp-tRNA(Asn)/Glu-tRNA(Gln) amidotransferase A subunit family amidase